jgi:hypothetical protein
MKRVFFMMGILAVVLLAANNLHAFTFDGPQALDDWTEAFVTGNFTSTPSGTQMQLVVNGSGEQGYGYGIRYKVFSNAIGITATFNVSSLGGYMFVGLGRYLGTTAAGNLIQVQIYLDTWGGYSRICYWVRERTTERETVRILAEGNLGADSGGLWTVGQNVTLAFARLGNDIYFYTPGNGAYVIVRPFETMGAVSDSDHPHYILGYTSFGEENYFTATVSEVSIVYP